MESTDQERSIREIQYNWAAREGLTTYKAMELIDHLLNLTGPQTEPICENVEAAGIRFIRWKFGFET